jgi:hypothetical protein
MSVLMPETPVAGRYLVAAEFEPHGVIDHLGQVVGDLDIGAQTEEDIAGVAYLVFFAPNPAVAEVCNGADAAVYRNALLAVGFILTLFTRRIAYFNVGQR